MTFSGFMACVFHSQIRNINDNIILPFGNESLYLHHMHICLHVHF